MSAWNTLRNLFRTRSDHDNERYLLPSLAVLIGVSIGVLVLTAITLTAQTNARTAARYALDTNTLLEKVYMNLRDAESGQRGYIITGDEAYLAPYTSGSQQVPALLTTVHARVTGTALQHELSTIKQLSEQKLAELAQTIQLRRTDGFDAALLVVRTNVGSQLMDETHARLATMESNINQQAAARRQTLDQTTLLTYIGLGSLCVMTALFSYFIRQLFRQLGLQRQRLEVLNTELNRSNRELQDFASVASHDLQEPLRKIQAFSNRLTTVGAIADNGQVYMERILDAAGRMRVLIDDLLAFSRVTTRAQPYVRVNLKRVVQEVLQDMEVRLEETGAHVSVESLPTIDADASQMRQVFQNLISNGVKFHRSGITPELKLYSKMVVVDNGQQQARIVVADNGIGFDTKYLDRIFTIFQRLHGRNKYEGTGIGLAVVRKIVERHHGSITAESQPGKGATFIINLPLKQPKPLLVDIRE